MPLRAAPQLGFFTVPTYPIVDVPFEVHVAAIDGNAAYAVTSATAVSLGLVTGTGTLGGTSSCTIPAGATGCTLSGTTYSVRELISATISATSGDALLPATDNVLVEGWNATIVAASPGPTAAGQPATFTATVSGTAPTGNVRFRDYEQVLCNAVALAGAGDSKTASCTTSPLSAGEHAITAEYAGDSKHNPATSIPVTHLVYRPSMNVALAANGGVASASSTISIAGSNFGVAAVNDGSHTGTWGGGGGWNDGTGGSFPDWVQIQFAGQKTIDKVVVTTLQDNFAAPVEPTDATTFSQYGVTSFQIQTWSGSAWVTKATVNGNNRVKRTIAIPATTTDRIRVLVNGALASYSRVVEIEAWTAGAQTSSAVSLVSTANPSVWGDPVTLIATVAGDSPTGRVSVTEDGIEIDRGTIVDGKATITLPLIGHGSHAFVAVYHGDARNIGSTSAPYVQVVDVQSGAVNVAAGGPQAAVVTASSTYAASGADFAPAAVNDNVRTGRNWGHGWGGGWNDATPDRFPDWVQISFGGMKTIDEVVVFTLQDQFESANTPTDVETFSQWGVTAFQVQSWNGTSWITQATVVGNHLVKRKVTFAPVTTDRIRVMVNGALASFSRLVEIEAWSRIDVPTTTSLTSSTNPVAPNQPAVFTASVTNVTANGYVDFRGGPGGTDYVCMGVPLAAGQAQCSVTSSTIGGYPVWAVYNGAPGTSGSSSPVLYQLVQEAPPSSNVALAANGGVASASSTISIAGSNFGVAAVNDGSHTGTWGGGGGWNDGTGGSFPDWVQIQFAGQKTIDKVVVTTLQDNFAAPVEPTDATTFSQYGVTSFQIQTWSGSAWVTKATVNGNNRVKRTIAIPATTTDRIRVLVKAALASYSRIVEIEAWTVSVAAKSLAASDSEATTAALPATVKAEAEASPIPVLSPAALTLLALALGLAGAAARRRRRPPP